MENLNCVRSLSIIIIVVMFLMLILMYLAMMVISEFLKFKIFPGGACPKTPVVIVHAHLIV